MGIVQTCPAVAMRRDQSVCRIEMKASCAVGLTGDTSEKFRDAEGCDEDWGKRLMRQASGDQRAESKEDEGVDGSEKVCDDGGYVCMNPVRSHKS